MGAESELDGATIRHTYQLSYASAACSMNTDNRSIERTKRTQAVSRTIAAHGPKRLHVSLEHDRVHTWRSVWILPLGADRG